MLRYLEISTSGYASLNRSFYPIQVTLLKCIKPLRYIRYSRINIDIMNEVRESDAVIFNGSPICRIVLFEHIDALIKLSEPNIVRRVYELAFQGLKKLWAHNGWSQLDLTTVEQEIVRANYPSDLILLKRIVSKDKVHSAELQLSAKGNCTDVALILSSKAVRTKKMIQILRTHSNPFLFKRYFHKHFWNEVNNYIVTDSKEEILFVCNIYTGIVKIELISRSTPMNELRMHLELLKFEENEDNYLKQMQLPLADFHN